MGTVRDAMLIGARAAILFCLGLPVFLALGLLLILTLFKTR